MTPVVSDEPCGNGWEDKPGRGGCQWSVVVQFEIVGDGNCPSPPQAHEDKGDDTEGLHAFLCARFCALRVSVVNTNALDTQLSKLNHYSMVRGGGRRSEASRLRGGTLNTIDTQGVAWAAIRWPYPVEQEKDLEGQGCQSGSFAGPSEGVRKVSSL
jgi:hypothetical protein